MSWVSLSILSAVIFAWVHTVDKYVLEKWVKNPAIPVVIYGVTALLASSLIFLFRGFSPLSPPQILMAFIAGVFFIFSNIFYFRAVKIGEISRVAPLFYLTPLFVLIIAALFLGEIFSPPNYLGIFFLITGAVLLSSKNFLKISLGKAFWLMTASCLTLSVSYAIIKHLLRFADFWTIFSWSRMGAFLATIPIFYLNIADLASTVKVHGKRVVGIIFLNESVNLSALFLNTAATAIGYVTLVNALSSTESFFLLLFVVILSIFQPKILKEEVSKSIVGIKLLSIALMFAGAVLII